MIRETADAPLRQRNSFHVEERAERLIEFDRKEDLDLIFGQGRLVRSGRRQQHIIHPPL